VILKLLLLVLLVFLLISFGVLGLVLRGLFGILYSLRGGGNRPRAEGDAAAAPHRGPRFGMRSRQAARAENMLPCAVCGVHVPESEGVYMAGEFFCCDAHRRLREETAGK
jgi:uncharacterized protein